jgi:hypothetical protein
MLYFESRRRRCHDADGDFQNRDQSRRRPRPLYRTGSTGATTGSSRKQSVRLASPPKALNLIHTHLVSPDNSRDALYLRNYAQLNEGRFTAHSPAWGRCDCLAGLRDARPIDPFKLWRADSPYGRKGGCHPRANAQPVPPEPWARAPAPTGTEFQLAAVTQGD